jgi:hypothetical protein
MKKSWTDHSTSQPSDMNIDTWQCELRITRDRYSLYLLPPLLRPTSPSPNQPWLWGPKAPTILSPEPLIQASYSNSLYYDVGIITYISMETWLTENFHINSLNFGVYPLKTHLTYYLPIGWIIFNKSTLKFNKKLYDQTYPPA